MIETNVIVGAGQAGAWAAVSMRQAGFAGRIVLIGEEPHRPYERPPLSKQALTAAEEPPVLYFHAVERYAENAIELLLDSRVEALEPSRVRLRDGRAIPFNRLLLATGGRARRLDVPGAEHVLYLRTLEDSRTIRAAVGSARNVVCIGAGVIGLEIASSARARGCAVTVLEALPTPMGRCVSAEGARFIEELHRKAGAVLHFGAVVQAVVAGPCGDFRVICADGTEAAGDVVLAGIGMERNVELAVAAGIAVDRGILVDEYGRTNLPGIFAAGDVAAFHHPLYGRHIRLESWRHAQNHGTAVAKVMAGQLAPYDDVPWFWTDQHGVNLQVTGFPADAARTVTRPGAGPDAFAMFHLDATNVVVGVTAVNSPRESRAGQSLVKAARPVSPEGLVDPNFPLQKLAAGARG